MFPGSYSISEETSYSKNPTATNGFKKNLTKTCGQGNVRSGICPVGEMSWWENVQSGKCPVGQLSVGEVSIGKVPVVVVVVVV